MTRSGFVAMIVGSGLALGLLAAIRRLTAILAADVAGYSSLIGADREGRDAIARVARRGGSQ
jgi:hypothetical protein